MSDEKVKATDERAKTTATAMRAERQQQAKQILDEVKKNVDGNVEGYQKMQMAEYEDLIQRAEAKGLNLLELIQLVRKYGPLIFEIIQGLLKDIGGADPTY